MRSRIPAKAAAACYTRGGDLLFLPREGQDRPSSSSEEGV